MTSHLGGHLQISVYEFVYISSSSVSNIIKKAGQQVGHFSKKSSNLRVNLNTRFSPQISSKSKGVKFIMIHLIFTIYIIQYVHSMYADFCDEIRIGKYFKRILLQRGEMKLRPNMTSSHDVIVWRSAPIFELYVC